MSLYVTNITFNTPQQLLCHQQVQTMTLPVYELDALDTRPPCLYQDTPGENVGHSGAQTTFNKALYSSICITVDWMRWRFSMSSFKVPVSRQTLNKPFHYTVQISVTFVQRNVTQCKVLPVSSNNLLLTNIDTLYCHLQQREHYSTVLAPHGRPLFPLSA